MRYTQPVANRWENWGLGIGLVLAAAGCVACGGRSESEPDSGEPTGSDAPNGNGNGSDDGSDGEATTGDDDGPNGDLPLDECVEGWPVFERECPWQGSDDLCYATKEAACACLCPRDTNSTCVSGLPGGPNDQVAVSCF